METIINVNGKDHKFRITAATTYIYRQTFGKDLLKQFQRLAKAKKGELPDNSVDLMGEVAFVAARQADKTIPNDITEWMDQFDLMDFYEIVLPEVFKLWQKTNQTTTSPKK